MSVLINNNLFPVEKFDMSKFSKENTVSFTGSAMQHPYEDDKFVLICDPISDHTEFIEFFKSDLVFIEEIESISTNKGESVIITRVWIKSGALALKVHPFVVTKTTQYIGRFGKKD